MSWVMEGDWRCDVGEGPYDTLDVYMKGDAQYSIFRGPPTGSVTIRLNGEPIHTEESVAKARAWVEHEYQRQNPTAPRKKPVRVRGFLGEQSFEITEGWTLMMDAVAVAMVFNSTYRTERENNTSAPEARDRAAIAVKKFQKAQP